MAVDLQHVLERLGSWGRYQKRIFCLVCLYAVQVGLTAISWVFIGAIPKHRCFLPAIDDNGKTPVYALNDAQLRQNLPMELPETKNLDLEQWQYSQCLRYNPPIDNTSAVANISVISQVEKCDKFVYDHSVYVNATVATDFDLVCDNAWQHSLVQSFYMVGVLVGSIVVGELADLFGRKPVLAACTALAIAFSVLNYFSWSLWTFAITRCCVGFCMTGIYLLAVVLGMELVGPSTRIFAGMALSTCFAIGEMIMGLLANFVRDWRLLQMIITMPIVLYLVVLFFIPESIRWLYAKKRYVQAETLLQRVAYTNGAVIEHEWLLDLRNTYETNDVVAAAAADNDDDRSSLKHAFFVRFEMYKHSVLRKRIAVQLVCWFVASMVYYGLSMETQLLGGNDFFNSILVSAIEIPTYVVLYLVLDTCGRRIPLIVCFALAGFACIALGLLPMLIENDGVYTVALALFGKAGIAAAFAICYIYAAELFPTKYRSQALGLCSMIGHAGPILSPFIALLSVIDKSVPYLIFGGVGLVAALVAPILPETAGSELPETVEDAQLLGSRSRRRPRVVHANAEEDATQARPAAENEPLLRDDD